MKVGLHLSIYRRQCCFVVIFLSSIAILGLMILSLSSDGGGVTNDATSVRTFHQAVVLQLPIKLEFEENLTDFEADELLDDLATLTINATTTEAITTTESLPLIDYIAKLNKLDSYKQIFEDRRQVVSDQCMNSMGHRPGDTEISRPIFVPNKNFLDFLLVNEEHNILFCSVPKVASTNWRRFFVQFLTGKKELPFPETELHNEEAMLPYLKPIRYKSKERPEKLIQRVQNYTKIMWVRDPLRRLYSAWRSKFAVKNEYYWEHFGPHLYQNVLHKDTPYNISADPPLITLEEFFRFLSGPAQTIDDVHWTAIYRLCLSCYIDYDYIGHLEDGIDEFNYVIKKVTGQSRFGFNSKNDDGSSTPDVSDSAMATAQLKQIPRRTLRSVIRKYQHDFAMFDYDLPEEFNPPQMHPQPHPQQRK